MMHGKKNKKKSKVSFAALNNNPVALRQAIKL